MRSLFEWLGVIVVVIGLVVGVSFGGLWLYKAVAPAWEEARTDVYRNTKSYTEGSIRDLRRLKREYDNAEDSHKSALRTIILQRSDEINMDQMPSDVVRFIETMQTGD